MHTYLDIIKNTSFLIRFALSRVDCFEKAVFMLSCGRVKMKLFEAADVTALIYDVSEHSHRSMGIIHKHFRLSVFCVEDRTAKF